MTHHELITQMLEALSVATTPLAKDRQEVLAAITAAREYLAAPEQSEPVAYRVSFNAKLAGARVTDHLIVWRKSEATKQVDESLITAITPLYTHPAPKAEPVNQMLLDKLKGASNYIDKLGGVSQPYRQAIAAAEKEMK